MSAEQAFNPGVQSAMTTALMLCLALAVSTLASYVALDLARRVRVLRTGSGALWLLGAASAMALGIWSSQVIGIAAEPLAFPVGYDGLGTLGVWTAALVASLAGLGAVSGRVATPGRVGFGAFALGIGAVGTHALSIAPIGLMPGVEWQLLPFVAAFAGAAGGCMAALGAFFRGGDRTKPATPGWQATSALVFAISLVASQQLVLGAAGIGDQVGSANAERLTSTTLTLFASVGSCAILLIGLLFSVLEARMRRTLRRAETELQRRSFRDGLTGLPNRLMFDGMLAQAVQQAHSQRQKLAVLFIDLDGFKPVNESLGHVTGDLVLREIAARLKRFARPEDRVAHLGGDEYLMLVGGDPSGEDAAIFAERLLVSIGEPCRMNGTRGDRLELDRHRPLSRARADRRPDRQRRGGDALGQERRRRRLRLLRAADDERRARPARSAARPASSARRRPAAPGLPAEDPRAERRDHRRRGADALGASGARPGRTGPLHPDRRALRPDRRDGQLADRGSVPAGRHSGATKACRCASRSTSRRISCAIPTCATGSTRRCAATRSSRSC